MKQWDTADWVLPQSGGSTAAANHPCVILSPNARCANKDIDTVNVLAASSHRILRLPRENEFLLDKADGMDWETLVRLDAIWLVPKHQLRARASVTTERRRQLGAKLIRLFGLWLGN